MVQLYHNHIALKMPVFRHFPAILGVLWQNMNMESSGNKIHAKTHYFASFGSYSQQTGVKNCCEKYKKKMLVFLTICDMLIRF